MRNVHDAQAGFLAFMRQIQNAAAIGPLLDREAFAPVAVAVEIVVADERHVVRFGLRLGAQGQNEEHGQQCATQCALRWCSHTRRRATGWRP